MATEPPGRACDASSCEVAREQLACTGSQWLPRVATETGCSATRCAETGVVVPRSGRFRSSGDLALRVPPLQAVRLSLTSWRCICVSVDGEGEGFPTPSRCLARPGSGGEIGGQGARKWGDATCEFRFVGAPSPMAAECCCSRASDSSGWARGSRSRACPQARRAGSADRRRRSVRPPGDARRGDCGGGATAPAYTDACLEDIVALPRLRRNLCDHALEHWASARRTG
jgi:hypothetical protein